MLRLESQFQLTMTSKEAVQHIKTCSEQMDARYHHKVVFDEWAVIALGGRKGRLLAYIGPRRAGFQRNFLTDAGPLMDGLLAQNTNPGDFEFARHGIGTGFEAFLTLGENIFLICNNTVQDMDGITKDPCWIGAQVAFVDLSEKFRADPMEVENAPAAQVFG